MMFTLMETVKKIGRVARLSGQIEKLCNASDNMSQPTCNLTPAMDPYGIPQANYLIACRRKFQKLWTIRAVMKVMMKGRRKRFYNAWNVLTNYFLLHLLLCNFIMRSIY
ncbi:hypothetical protein Gotur_003110 [Gossypium turneri]